MNIKHVILWCLGGYSLLCGGFAWGMEEEEDAKDTELMRENPKEWRKKHFGDTRSEEFDDFYKEKFDEDTSKKEQLEKEKQRLYEQAELNKIKEKTMQAQKELNEIQEQRLQEEERRKEEQKSKSLKKKEQKGKERRRREGKQNQVNAQVQNTKMQKFGENEKAPSAPDANNCAYDTGSDQDAVLYQQKVTSHELKSDNAPKNIDPALITQNIDPSTFNDGSILIQKNESTQPVSNVTEKICQSSTRIDNKSDNLKSINYQQTVKLDNRLLDVLKKRRRNATLILGGTATLLTLVLLHTQAWNTNALLKALSLTDSKKYIVPFALAVSTGVYAYKAYNLQDVIKKLPLKFKKVVSGVTYS